MMIAMRKSVTVAFGIALGSTLAPLEARAQAATVGSEAYGVYVKMASLEQPRAPRAALANGAVMAHDQAASFSVPNVVNAENLFATATGAGESHDVSAQSSVTLERVDILNGLIAADLVMAIASSAIHTTAVSNADGTTFADLVVNGVPVAADVAPNTRIDLPGVGYVVLNERLPSGDGATSTGLSVRMIHVVLRDAVTGATRGEIVVGAASSYVRQ